MWLIKIVVISCEARVSECDCVTVKEEKIERERERKTDEDVVDI
jgi:hypothetical protein